MKSLLISRRLLIFFPVFLFFHTAYCQIADDYRTAASGNWNANATWQRYDGTTWVNVNGIAPNTIPASGDGNITILTTHTVTITANVTIDQATVNSGGQLVINSGRTLTIANGAGTDLTITGILSNAGSITTTGILDFAGGGSYIHNKNGGPIPTATWNAASDCIITGVTGTVPSGLAQSFGNFTWNCTAQTSNINFNGAITAIAGNFTVASTGTTGSLLRLTNATNLTLNIGGDFVLSGGDLIFTNSSANVTINVTGSFSQTGGSLDFSDFSQIGVLMMNITANFSQSGGFFDFSSGAAIVTRTPALSIGGNFSQTGTAGMITSTSDADIVNGTITFNKNGIQTFSITTQGNLIYVNFIVAAGSNLQLNSNLTLTSSSTNNWAGSFILNSGGALDAGTYQLLSSTGSGAGTNNDFVLNSGASIIIARADGLQSGTTGTISASIANRTYSSGANYTYNGTTTQNSGIFATTPVANQVNNLTVNNTGGSTGLTLQQSFSIAGTCTFTAGLITSSSVNLIIFNDDAIASGANNNPSNPSYVNGPVRKTGNDVFTFPVGKTGAGYRSCAISSPANITDAFTAEFMRASASALGSITASGLVRVSGCEYWQINRTTGTSSVNVTLSWSGLSNCNAAAYVNSLSALVVAHFGTAWDLYGANSFTGTASAGTVTWNNVSSFSPFSLGSTTAASNPLPVKFTLVKAYKISGANKIEWTNATESGIMTYEVEKSADGRLFQSLFNQAARYNNGQAVSYQQTDINNTGAVSYYRIKANTVTGESFYSAVVKVQQTPNAEDIQVYPNPVINKQFTLQINKAARGTVGLEVFNANGQKITGKTIQHPGGQLSVTIDLPVTVKPGLYFLKVSKEGMLTTEKILIQ